MRGAPAPPLGSGPAASLLAPVASPTHPVPSPGRSPLRPAPGLATGPASGRTSGPPAPCPLLPATLSACARASPSPALLAPGGAARLCGEAASVADSPPGAPPAAGASPSSGSGSGSRRPGAPRTGAGPACASLTPPPAAPSSTSGQPPAGLSAAVSGEARSPRGLTPSRAPRPLPQVDARWRRPCGMPGARAALGVMGVSARAPALPPWPLPRLLMVVCGFSASSRTTSSAGSVENGPKHSASGVGSRCTSDSR